MEIGKSFDSIQGALEKVEKYTEELAESNIKKGLSAALDSFQGNDQNLCRRLEKDG